MILLGPNSEPVRRELRSKVKKHVSIRLGLSREPVTSLLPKMQTSLLNGSESKCNYLLYELRRSSTTE